MTPQQSNAKAAGRTILPADGRSSAEIQLKLKQAAAGPITLRLCSSSASIALDLLALLLMPAILVVKTALGQPVNIAQHWVIFALMALLALLAVIRLSLGTAGSFDAKHTVRKLELAASGNDIHVTVYAAKHPGIAYLTAPGTSHRIEYKPCAPWQVAFLDWLPTLNYALLFALIFRSFLFASFYIPSASMEDTLTEGDLLIGNKFTYKVLGRNPQRGDVMVFVSKPELNKDPKHRLDFIKRVIGLPGDTVEVRSGKVFVNNKQLDEPYIKEEPYEDFDQVTVPPDSFFMMGDNRNHSNDSRFWGYVPRQDLEGRAMFVFWPPKHMGRIN